MINKTCVHFANKLPKKKINKYSHGQLGQGHVNNIGDGPNEMGNNLPPISFGSQLSVKAIAAGWYHTCALLSNDSVKCFGNNG